MNISIIYYTYKKSIKTNLLEENVNFVDNTEKQNKYFKKIMYLFVIVMFLFLSYKVIFIQL